MTFVEINGAEATPEVLHRAATWNYGHYTSMQVRNRAVAGLDDHLRRLHDGSATLFPAANAPTSADIIGYIRRAIRDLNEASVRVAVLPRPGLLSVDVMVSVSDPVPDVSQPPLRVRGITYERELPQLKHMATMGLTYHALAAKADGFDDVLFYGRDGFVREGSVWNAVFLDDDGNGLVWPSAPMLEGITMQVLRRSLTGLGIPSSSRPLSRADVAGMRGAAATNSHDPGRPIAAIDGTAFPATGELTALLRRAWEAVTWDPLDA